MIGFKIIEKSKAVAALSKFGFGGLLNFVKNIDKVQNRQKRDTPFGVSLFCLDADSNP